MNEYNSQDNPLKMKPTIKFNESALSLVLEAFGKSIENNIIIDSKTKEPILTPEGDEIDIKDFGGIKKGSEIYIKNDLYALLKLEEGKY